MMKISTQFYGIENFEQTIWEDDTDDVDDQPDKQQ